MAVGIENVLDNSRAGKECKSGGVGDRQEGERQAFRMI